MIASTPTDCSFQLQAETSNRATLVTQARDGNNAVELTTQPGDSNLYGSGTAERADLDSGSSPSYCNQGQAEWWAHSLLFPDNYVVPPAGSTWNWGVVFDFHHSGPTGQPNFQIASLPTDPGFYRVPIGAVVKNQWYDFVYHVKWSSGSDGFFQAWVNGQQSLNYNGPTLYVGQSCYLKLANYHTPLGVAISVVHDRIVRGSARADVEIPISNPAPVVVPNVVAQTQAAASMMITGAGFVLGTVTQQSSNAIAAGGAIQQSPAAGTNVASGVAVNLVVSSDPTQVAVPNVVSQTQAQATAAIAAAGLAMGAATQQSSSSVPSGSIISQSPAADTNVASGIASADPGGGTGGGSSGGSNGGSTSASSGAPSSSGQGGGGVTDVLTLGALLAILILALQRMRLTRVYARSARRR